MMKGYVKTITAGIGLAMAMSLGTVQFAAAEQVTEFTTSGILPDAGSPASVYALPSFMPGTYVAQLTDLQFPASFEWLRMGISKAGFGLVDSVILTGGAATGGFTFDVLPNADYFLGIVGVAGVYAPVAGLPEIRLSSYAANISLVPIPAAALLMSSALVGLVVVARRRRSGDEETGA